MGKEEKQPISIQSSSGSRNDPGDPKDPVIRPQPGGREEPVSRWRYRPISNEPLINAVHRHIAEMAFISYAAVLIYMSFVPFDFKRNASPWRGPGLTWGLAVAPFSLRDILANICFYLPLGALAYAVWRRRNLGRIVSFLAAVLSALAVSLMVEYGQHWVASRVSTWVDVTSNVLGGLIGAILFVVSESHVRPLAARAGSTVGRNWPLTLAKAAVCIVLLIQLRPYDVVVDLFHTAAGLRHADTSPLAGWNQLQTLVSRQAAQGRRLGMNELPRARYEYALDRLGDTTGYAVVTALLVLGMAPPPSRRAATYLGAGLVAVSLATMVTLIRCFLISHGLDTAHFICGVLGWPIGCVIGHALLRAARRTENKTEPPQPARPRPLLVVPAGWRNVAIVGILAVVILYEIVPFDFGTGSVGSPGYARKACLLPFLAHFHARPNDAFYDLSGKVLRYAIMGACLSLLIRYHSRAAWRRQLGAAIAATGLAAAAFECLHLVMASRHADVTTVLLAITGAFAGAVAVRWAFDYRSSLEPEVVNDLLTGQLIEGGTYKPLPGSQPRSEVGEEPLKTSTGRNAS